MASQNTSQWRSFLVRFIFPTAITIALFLTSIFSIVIPTIEKNSLDRKREMIRELTNSAWNILAKFQHDEQQGLITRAEAQKQAIEQIRNLHYGQEMKDYFWINDMHPRMVIHPYRTDLNGKDLSNYTDPDGKRVFVEFVNVVKKQGSGYVNYMWQWKDVKSRIVPKISYVKGFAPWGWIIGTGIYIEDVKAEIASIIRNVIEISLFILGVMSVLLATIIVQSFRTERQRRIAEQALQESEEKYRTLVESAAEGMLMALEGRYMYANQTIVKLLEYSQEEFSGMPVADIFTESKTHPSYHYVQDFIAGNPPPERFEAQLKTKGGDIKEVILSTSPIAIGGRAGYIVVATDITKRKQAEEALGESEEKFRTLANNLNVGVFRRTIGSAPKFIEVNPALVTLLGYSSKQELLSISVVDLYVNPEDRKKLEPKVQQETSKREIKREIVKLKKKDGTLFFSSIWAVIVKDESGNPQYVDGILEDITDIKSREEEQARLLSEMQAALLFLNQPLESLHLRAVVSCSPTTSVQEAVALLDQKNTDVLLVRDDQGNNAGVITDLDLRKNVIAKGCQLDKPVSRIMSSPVVSAPAQACIFEAGLLMEQKKISHLFVTDNQETVIGVLRSDNIAAIQKYSPTILLREIQQAKIPEDIIKQNAVLPYLVSTLINSGAKSQYINHLTTIIVDAVLQKFIDFAIEALGSPPGRFAFIVFGSEGRQEQTLRTDQDNAIIYEDVPHEREEAMQAYFLNLGKKVCGWLNQAGYSYCEGNNMAQNPQWCQPVSTWKRYFGEWIAAGTAEDLLKTKIFFDFRGAYGEQTFVHMLRNHLNEVIAQNPRFFQLLARNVLQLSPPIGFFGNFVVESVGENKKAFDIKSSMMPIVDYARIYALQHNIAATNTFERLQQLYERNLLSQQNYQEMIQAYSYLMQIRLRVQAEAISQGNRKPENYVSPKNLTYIEQKLLKEIFSQTKNFQARLSYDFTGQLGGV
jgi:PAS domain S-box-containing protein